MTTLCGLDRQIEAITAQYREETPDDRQWLVVKRGAPEPFVFSERPFREVHAEGHGERPEVTALLRPQRLAIESPIR